MTTTSLIKEKEPKVIKPVNLGDETCIKGTTCEAVSLALERDTSGLNQLSGQSWVTQISKGEKIPPCFACISQTTEMIHRVKAAEKRARRDGVSWRERRPRTHGMGHRKDFGHQKHR